VTSTQTGILVAAVLAISWAAFGFWPFVGIAAAVAAGALIGRVADGKLDVSSLVDTLRGRRSSS